MESIKYTCLFGGGAIRGAAHVGVLKAFKKLGLECDVYGGSSVGSIIAALCAVGYNEDELAEIFLSVNFELFRDISFGFNNKFALSKGEVFLDWIRELIEKKYYGEDYDKTKDRHVKFKDLKNNLIIITTDMHNFKCCEFSSYETPDFEVALAVRISCCMPGLMRALNIEDKLLVDGDLMKGKPMWYLSKNLRNSENRIMEIRLEGEFSGDDKNPLSYINGIYSCMTYSETDFIKEIYGSSDKYDYLVINTGNVVVVDFNYPPEKRQQIIDGGYNQTISYFTEVLPSKKRNLYNIYEQILEYFRRVQGNILGKKYIKAKNNLSELFILLSDTNNIIDPALYSEIKMFQKLLFSNIKSGLLGYSHLDNADTVVLQLKNIIKVLSIKLKELEEYLKEFPV